MVTSAAEPGFGGKTKSPFPTGAGPCVPSIGSDLGDYSNLRFDCTGADGYGFYTEKDTPRVEFAHLSLGQAAGLRQSDAAHQVRESWVGAKGVVLRPQFETCEAFGPV